MTSRMTRGVSFWASALSVWLGLFGCAGRVAQQTSPIEFNQQFIESRRDFFAGHLPARGVPGSTICTAGIEFDSPRTVLDALFHALPTRLVIYPTELYYYFSFRLGHRHVHGNLNFVDADDGALRLGYFDAYDVGDARFSEFGSADGLAIDREGPSRWRIQYRGRTLHAVHPTPSASQEEPPRLPSERLISPVLDESGFGFHLYYDEIERGFLYVLDPAQPVVDTLLPIDIDPRFLVGSDSRFVFYSHRIQSVRGEHARLLLVGVHSNEVSRNSYFDGPFDQVPPRLDLKPYLELAYPYVMMRGGIDEHGNFLQLDNQRVAISSYQAYESLNSLVRTLGSIANHEIVPRRLLSLLTYETKKDFHRTSPSSGPDILGGHTWPANHWGNISRGWNENHARQLSVRWPANHESSSSLSGVTPAIKTDDCPP